MPRREFITPSSLSVETQGRCITIPASREWLGLVNAALLMLTETWRYEQIDETSLTPEETAAVAYEMYVAYLSSGCSDMTCEDVIQCLLDAGLLGNSVPNGDLRQVDGVPQVSYDGGTTWQDVPGDENADPITPPSVPTPGSDADIRKCLAATRAAMVLDEVYQGVYGAVTADIYNASNAFANWLANLNNQLLGLVYGEAAQVLNAEIMRTWALPTNYTAASLTTEQLEQLICFLLQHATDNPSGIVTFDWGAIRDNMISEMGVNPGTALWSIVVYLKNRGIERASQVAITETGNCGSCGGCEDCTPTYGTAFQLTDPIVTPDTTPANAGSGFLQVLNGFTIDTTGLCVKGIRWASTGWSTCATSQPKPAQIRITADGVSETFNTPACSGMSATFTYLFPSGSYDGGSLRVDLLIGGVNSGEVRIKNLQLATCP